MSILSGYHHLAVAFYGTSYSGCRPSLPSTTRCIVLHKIVLALALIALLDEISFTLPGPWSTQWSGSLHILGTGRMTADAYGMLGCEGVCDACVRRYGCMTPAWGQCCTHFYQHNGRKRSARIGDVKDVSMSSLLTRFNVRMSGPWLDASPARHVSEQAEPHTSETQDKEDALKLGDPETEREISILNRHRSRHPWRRLTDASASLK